jgi:1-aminocyclopropane-1-carboxylate deaminase
LHIDFLNFAKLNDTTYAANKFFNFAKTVPLNFDLIELQRIHAEWLENRRLSLDVLRLDKLHPIVSGNKWFKLKYYLKEASESGKKTIATFGGAWSNHIVATAFAAKEQGLKSVGIIRGEKPATLSNTLQQASQLGMELHFVTRNEYRQKEALISKFSDKVWYWVNEGGYGINGMKGAAEILNTVDTTRYTHIIAAAGTGTMLAGLLKAAHKNQKVIGISVMKGNATLHQQIEQLIQKPTASFQLIHEYHFGGYAKHPQNLIDYINNVYRLQHLPLDIIYTGKTFYAIQHLAEKDFFERDSRLLMIHSGGLQGNSSLPAKVLAF